MNPQNNNNENPFSPYDVAMEEQWKSAEAQGFTAPDWEIMGKEQRNITEKKFGEAEKIHQYILEELGDIELAQRIAEHPEVTAQIVSGEGTLSPDFFSMIRAIAKKNTNLAVALVREAQHQGHLLETNVDIVGIGTTAEDTERFLLQHFFEINENAVLPYPGEMEKTAYDLSAIGYASTELQKIRKSLNLPEYTVIPEQVKLLDQSALPPSTAGKHDMYGQRALIAPEANQSLTGRMAIIIHELVHANAYGAIEVWRDEQGRQNIAIRRRGLNVRNSKEENGNAFLDWLNEAVTDELTNRLMRDIPQDHPEFGNTVKERNKNVNEVIERRRLVPDRYHRAYWFTDPEKGEVLTTAYLKEKQLMYYLFKKMYTSAPEHFLDMTLEEADEELFSMLTKGAFTGNILPFGRLFNDTFGHGKFREFGHLQTVEEQKAFIDAL